MNEILSSQKILNMVLCSLMLLTAVTTRFVTPSKTVQVHHADISLKAMVPEKIGTWAIDPYVVPLQLSADQEKTLKGLYNETLSRTYVNPAGERVMLSVAYGGDQSGNLALHKPEQCYGAQGFQISNFERDDFSSDNDKFPVTRLLAVQGQRSEPITYWTTVGDKVVRDGLEQKLQKLRYAMTGKIPDGILVRVSTIDSDLNNSYRIQNTFIQDMLSAMKQADRAKIIGKIGA
ncbi:EpsI family protein [Oxalobacteraceae bacterium GrIS 1.18]